MHLKMSSVERRHFFYLIVLNVNRRAEYFAP